MSQTNQRAVQLYRELFRQTYRLPRYALQCCCLHEVHSRHQTDASALGAARSSWEYYRRQLRQNFIAHNQEDEPDRIEQIMVQGREAADWVVQKVRHNVASASVCCLSHTRH